MFFLDEAHLLFTGASKAFLEAVTQTVRLIRSKGVGVFFVTQNPTDVPSSVLGQLGNRVQHALRTFTPEDADALRKTVRTFPKSDDYDLGELLTALGTGEAAVTVLSERGRPDAGRVDDAAGAAVVDGRGRRAGARRRRRRLAAAGQVRRGRSTGSPPTSGSRPGWRRRRRRAPAPEAPAASRRPSAPPAPRAGRSRSTDDGGVVGAVLGSSAFRSFARSAASALGREISRGIFGTRRRR